jgi:hypothetical protein
MGSQGSCWHCLRPESLSSQCFVTWAPDLILYAQEVAVNKIGSNPCFLMPEVDSSDINNGQKGG